jgi:hypothetical protein
VVVDAIPVPRITAVKVRANGTLVRPCPDIRIQRAAPGDYVVSFLGTGKVVACFVQPLRQPRARYVMARVTPWPFATAGRECWRRVLVELTNSTGTLVDRPFAVMVVTDTSEGLAGAAKPRRKVK